MEFYRPSSWREALEIKGARPEAVPIFGGTDMMVSLNFGRERPEAMMDLTGVEDLGVWAEEEGRLRVGAGVSYARIIEELAERLPGLAMASRTVGSPQIRNRGTVGGNLGTASPAGDALPPLYVSDAEVEVASIGGTRRVPVAEFITGPKKNALRPDELISAFLHAGGRGAATVLQDRDPQRDGDRRVRLRPCPPPGEREGSGPAWARRRRPRCGPMQAEELHRGRPRGGGSLGVAGRDRGAPRCGASESWWRRRPGP